MKPTLGAYDLLVLLARGGMAEIYLARRRGSRSPEPLVIKRIHPPLARRKAFVEMFLDEARISSRLEHPHIVRVVEVSREGHELYMVMEYLEGVSLGRFQAEALSAGLVLTPELCGSLIAQACRGLEHAHNLRDPDGAVMNLVHRDISPQNLVVLSSGRVKLVDFGIAKAAGRIHQTKTGWMKGHLAYMSPEQIRSEAVDRRSDIFSLGVVFWELLTAQRLFRRDSPAKTVQAVLHDPIPAVRSVAPQVPWAWARIPEQALERNPAERFPSAGAMEQAIQRTFTATRTSSTEADVAAFFESVIGHIPTAAEVLRSITHAKRPGAHATPVVYLGQGSPVDQDEVSTLVVDIPTLLAGQREASAKAGE